MRFSDAVAASKGFAPVKEGGRGKTASPFLFLNEAMARGGAGAVGVSPRSTTVYKPHLRVALFKAIGEPTSY